MSNVFIVVHTLALIFDFSLINLWQDPCSTKICYYPKYNETNILLDVYAYYKNKSLLMKYVSLAKNSE